MNHYNLELLYIAIKTTQNKLEFLKNNTNAKDRYRTTWAGLAASCLIIIIMFLLSTFGNKNNNIFFYN
jgi:uncharacterized membrane protein YvbJ